MRHSGYKVKNAVAVNEFITVSKQHFSGGYFFKGESHNSYELVCVLEGRVGITAGKEILSLSAGQMTLHTPLEFHAIWEQELSRPTCIVISFSASAFPVLRSRIYTLSEALVRSIEEIYESSKQVFEITPHHRPATPQRVARADYDFGIAVGGIREGKQFAASKLAKEFELFLMYALESPSDREIRSPDSAGENYAKILEVMEAHLYERLDMTALSALCGMSVPLIEKTVYRYLGCGAMSYYNGIRMNKAHDLLAHGESVKKTAAILGFSTQNYFSLSFKKHFGYPPSQVRAT